MRFMTMIKSVENAAGPPPKELMDAIANLGMEAAKGGVKVEPGGLLPSAAGALLRLTSDGTISFKDGPFSEAKELIGGYAIYTVNSKAEAVEWARRFLNLHKQHWKGWQGEVEVRQLMEFGEFGPPA